MAEQQEDELIPGPCCFYFRYGKCEPPRPPCRFRHEEDDGIRPCCFGPTCRLGHSKRVHVIQSEKAEFWREYNADDATVGSSPAVRDATLLRSQLEPWPTSVLRERLASVFGEVHRDLDPLGRGELMRKLLEHYKASGPRKVIRVLGSPVREDLCDKLLAELILWRTRHTTNTRPSINSKSYMILRSPMEFGQKTSNNAKAAAKKLSQNQQLWDMAEEAIREVDPEYADNFSALAVTYGFKGSPHIDKQNTGPFYGLAIGSFLDGQGGICVESSPLVVAHVNTKNRLGKVDGRFPHWVAPYDDEQSKERYSLIYYSTWQEYVQPTAAFFGPVLPEEDSI